MGERDQGSKQSIQQVDFEEITTLVYAEFQVEDALMEHNVPTYYLKQQQETKKPFLRLLKNLEKIGFTAFLRRKNGRIVLRVIRKPSTKPSNILINWLLFLTTIVTTFLTGYFLSARLLNPWIGGATFTIAIMTVLGTHEMGHKITANRKGVEATPPYFIPGPPPIGTFGAVIMQKSLPPNKDALFDIGSSGPIVGFITATLVAAIGLTLAIPAVIPPEEVTTLPTPLMLIILSLLLGNLGMIPTVSGNQRLFMHPVEFAGWVGLLVTMLNLLPAAMLDGGHVSRCLAGEKTRVILTALSIVLLIYKDFWLMAIFVLFLSMYKHPGPLDDVSSLSIGRKLLTVGVTVIFILSFPFF